jgi:hypothetical protein
VPVAVSTSVVVPYSQQKSVRKLRVSASLKANEGRHDGGRQTCTCATWVHFDSRGKLHHCFLIEPLHQVALATQMVAMRVIRVLLHRDIVRLARLFEVAAVKMFPPLLN